MKRWHYFVGTLIIFFLGLVIIVQNYNLTGTYNALDTIYANNTGNNFSFAHQKMENTKLNLNKALLSENEAYSVMLLTEISSDAESAALSLSTLPIYYSATVEPIKYLNQISEYTRVLAEKTISGLDLTVEEQDSLMSMNLMVSSLLDQLESIATGKSSDAFAYESYRNSEQVWSTEPPSSLPSAFLSQYDGEDIIYEDFDYDGNFSDAYLSREASGLMGAEVTLEEAEKSLLDFLTANGLTGTPASMGENTGTIATYNFDIGDNRYAQVSKVGGKVINYLDGNPPSGAGFDREEAMLNAENLLKSIGLENMKATHQKEEEGVLHITFCGNNEETFIYTDSVLVDVSLGDGKIVGFDGYFYYMNTKERVVNEATLTIEEARNYVTDKLNITSERLALLNKAGGIEVLCYEFVGTFGEDTFTVYINAEDGSEEEIKQYFEDETGEMILE